MGKRTTKQKPKKASKKSMKERNPQANLLGLPRELRNEIYNHVLKERVNLRARGTAVRNAGLTLACTQLYIESIEQYYKDAIFYYDAKKEIKEEVVFKWLKRLPSKHRTLIKDIHFGPTRFYRMAIPTPWDGQDLDRYEKAMAYLWLKRNMKDRGIKGIC
ncbi:hypothetical protein CLAFUW4_12208 [Fulvia fulva]|uniref:Uncharacterized protein n=1 Tax=Passalora fulva TaxID=5499 RepID=A0A9Q8PEZ0_PASFU|nr:uncharacterized protein CLAFUR5_11239 [Fulvia fulva]KAK4617816.1 hypothetical protein CLAFUR4_12213 [Fulvia fulva]KAK4618686.1 hypothetical protein CLAFUR0_12224 [Fulvia fulva]UJO21261.1 hypothetical protein CLAFUR5_11239 [Fulvia fulva]WPV18262.1 hypothetical protein CLAFUW4_12208 [Fulvia fulva]WPV32904.1 hypothetical protein CLAFUW7_12215 [Fulvia fulva]